MFEYDNSYTESTWRHEADARELAELDWDRRDMQETLAPPLQMRLNLMEEKCCDNPAAYILNPSSFESDPDTGYQAEPFYRCTGCGNLICEEDYAAICEYTERQARLTKEIANQPKKAKEAA